MGDVKLYFILRDQYSDENETSEQMKQAFEISKQFVNNVVWEKESEFNAKVLKKTDIVVFERFEGKIFELLKESKCVRILGHQVLSGCLLESKEIPNYPWPILNISMYGLIICCSKLPKTEKVKIKEQVQLMGGCYTESLSEKTTHLITDSTKSEKYLVAAERGLNIMLPRWIDAVWDDRHNTDVHATNEKFNKFICLPFHNLTICTTGINKLKQKKELGELVEKNGGSLVGKMNLALTDVLICCGESGVNSEKYKAARQCPDISCLTIEWIYDSIKKGYAIRTDEYQVRKKATSTPTKEGLNPDFSMMSAIGEPNATKRTSIEETVNITTMSNINFDSPMRGRKYSPISEVPLSTKSQVLTSENFGQSEDTLAALLKNVENADLIENQIIAQVNTPTPDDTKSTSSQAESITIKDEESSQSCLFSGYKFILAGFDDDENETLIDSIESESGEIISENSKDPPNYIVLPAFIPSDIPNTTHKVVNNFWIKECIENGMLLDILYYHAPFVVEDDFKPLENCVVTLSSYSGNERQFLRTLIIKLGGVSQEQFARVSSTEKGILASTHLVSLEASGKKYQAALKWQLPVVTKDWLVDCVKTKQLLPEINYLLHESKNVNEKDTSPMATKCPEMPVSKASIEDESLEPDATANKQLTPISSRVNFTKNVVRTPENQVLQFCQRNTPDAVSSQVTPVNKILQEARRNHLLGTPKSPTRYYPWDPKTPETPIGGIMSRWSPQTRKEVEIFINMLPDCEPPKRRESTPLHVLKEKLRNKFFPDSGYDDCNVSNVESSTEVDAMSLRSDEEPVKDMVITKLQQLENMVNNSGGNRRSSRNFQSTLPASVAAPPSQPFTVSWDFTENKDNNSMEEKVFMMSGIENEQRQRIASQIIELGAQVSDLANYDPCTTHLLCDKPARNEKILSGMASGKWILHVSYIEKCYNEGKFVDEEEFEFGNPKCKYSKEKLDRCTQQRMQAMHWWRTEIAKRGYGAFHDMKAIVVANKREPIIRVIEAGGGIVIDAQPPFEGATHATHCLIEAKSVKDMSLYFPLAQQGIYCLSTLYISDFLHKTTKDISDCIFPAFAKYYKS